MKVLVTGGAGFIGSNIVKELLNQNHDVVVIDNLSTGNLDNLQDVMDKIKFVEGDITNLDTMMDACKDVDYVLHQAAIASVPRSIEDPFSSNKNNIDGTLNVLYAAKESGVKRVVYAGSSSAYGNSTEEYKNESINPEVLSPYAGTKLMGEYYCKIFSSVYRLETVSLRYFNVFGPSQDPDSEYSAVIPLFIKSILDDKSPTVHGDGTQSRDFTYVANNVKANILAMTSDKVGSGEIINIACGKSYSLLELIDSINKILNKNIESNFIESRAGDVKNSLADIKKAKELLGYEPEIDFLEGLEKTIEFYKK